MTKKTEWSIVGLMAAIFLSFFLIFKPIQISGESMVPNYPNGAKYLLARHTYWFIEPKRGDVVRYIFPSADLIAIGRIVGLPGEMVSLRDGRVVINGKVLDEFYLSSEIMTMPKGDKFDQETKLLSGEYYILGDNRENSVDSRQVGVVKKSMILGKVVFRYN